MDENKEAALSNDIDRPEALSIDIDQLETFSTDIDRLETLSRDDDWLAALIRDTEKNRMLKAPARLRTDTLAKVGKLQSSKRMQLIQYSVKVCTAAAAALFILFTTPVFLKPSLYPEAFASPPAKVGQSGLHLPEDGMAWDEMTRTRQTLREGFQQITGPLYDLSNELFPGR